MDVNEELKIKKKMGGGSGGWVRVGGVRVDVNEELSFCENSKKNGGGGGGSGSGSG